MTVNIKFWPILTHRKRILFLNSFKLLQYCIRSLVWHLQFIARIRDRIQPALALTG